MEAGHVRAYCAGPLFNAKEQEEMAQLAKRLEAAGYMTFLPQRDGLELTKCVDALVDLGVSSEQASSLVEEAIFSLDVYQVLQNCDVLVANLNGRVPDEGTVAEAAMAWARGKTVIGYKADARSAFAGQDNPLVTGLFGFNVCSTFEDVVDAVAQALHAKKTGVKQAERREAEMGEHIALGAAIWQVLQNGRRITDVADTIVSHRTHGTRPARTG